MFTVILVISKNAVNASNIFIPGNFQLIGKNIGQLFRKEAIIANLRPMTNPSANSTTYTSLLDSNNQETSIVSQLFSTNS